MPASRRQMLGLFAASFALSGCDPSAPDERYFPAVNQAASIVPGLPNHYATAFDDGGAAAGIIVRQDMGRPVKIEGNPAHPGSLGATSMHGQALLLDFYDVDRAAGVFRAGQPSTWQAVQQATLGWRAGWANDGGAGLRILTPPVLSPSLEAALRAVLAAHPATRWHGLPDARAEGLALAYGRPVSLVPHVERADVVLGLESDLISAAPGHLRQARDFASRRNPTRGAMSRIYAAEPAPTPLGFAADHRFPVTPAALQAALRAIGAAILGGAAVSDAPEWVDPVLADLRAAGPRALLHAGAALDPAAQALVHQINDRLGGRGTSFDLIDPIAAQFGGGTLADLMADMADGRVHTLIILGGNPAYTMPDFRAAMSRVPTVLYTAPAPDETAAAATWFVPETHLFEAWGDLRAHDGTVAIQQPQSFPLYAGRSRFEMLSLLTGAGAVSSLDAVRNTWKDQLDDEAWGEALSAGIVAGTASAPIAVEPVSPVSLAAAPPATLALLLRPDSTLGDGRWANNPWLQETPRFGTGIVWGNPLLLSAGTAAGLGLRNGDVVDLTAGTAKVTSPIWIQPGQADGTVVATLGNGRAHAGGVGTGVGVDMLPLNGQGAASLRPTGGRVAVASTHRHVNPNLADDIARRGTLEQFEADPHFLAVEAAPPSIHHKPRDLNGTAWGMSIDLNACIGCNACVTACQAENNVPVVGKAQVIMQREMHWLRIDPHFPTAGDPVLQPVLCMHCEDAPCEPVCPVGASVHDSEGLNLQVYNRCVGTRFCSNNCPYKVRRFNFGAWADEEARTPISRNPDVSVRGRGVMEKCTFCVQRIAAARIEHDRDGTKEQAVTACQAACPTQAFSFGDLNDADADVNHRKASPLNYPMLPEQNTRPRVTYEARIRNANPALPA